MKAPRALLAVLLLASVASFLIAAEAAAPSGVLTPEEMEVLPLQATVGPALRDATQGKLSRRLLDAVPAAAPAQAPTVSSLAPSDTAPSGAVTPRLNIKDFRRPIWKP